MMDSPVKQYYLYYTTCAAKRQGKYHTKICKKYPSRTVRRRTDSKNRLLADLDAEFELQVAENFLDEAVDLIGVSGLSAGWKDRLNAMLFLSAPSFSPR